VAVDTVGNPQLISLTFTNRITGAPADPSDIDLRYATPAREAVAIPFDELVHDRLGAWHYVLQTTGFDAGVYVVQCAGSEGLTAVSAPQTFVLAAPAVPGL
jgi:hypothetical protein